MGVQVRQVTVQVPRGLGSRVAESARKRQAINLVQFEGWREDAPLDVVIAIVSNRRVQALMEDLESIEEAHVTLAPQEMLALHPPLSEAAGQVVDVEARSPLEVSLSSRRSVGSWSGLLGYTAVASVVVWIGLFTNTIYLLIAAMLIAPYAGPAMSIAVGTATGDTMLLGRSLLRYAVSLGSTVVLCAVLTWLLGQRHPTLLMLGVSFVSSVAVLLPIVTGAAGALNLAQSEGSNLVSGTAVGILVAASLAPPAGVIGMAGAMGLWDMALRGAFILLLQLVGINLGGTLVFRAFRLSARGRLFNRGKRAVFWGAVALSVLAIAGLIVWQFRSTPNLQRASIAQNAAQHTSEVVDAYPDAHLVEVSARFTAPNVPDQDTLLVQVIVQLPADSTTSIDTVRADLARVITTRILTQGYAVTPVVDVTVIQVPPEP
ncbi:MAG: DUF389 domain-containing protein [Anaerolineae bacterium]